MFLVCYNPDSALKYLKLSSNEDHQQIFRASEKHAENLIEAVLIFTKSFNC